LCDRHDTDAHYTSRPMVRLTRWKIAWVILVILAALFIDGFGATYQLYASHVGDPNLGCGAPSLRGSGLGKASGTFTLTIADGPGKGTVINPPDAGVGVPGATEWSSGWNYNLSKGGGQQIAV